MPRLRAALRCCAGVVLATSLCALPLPATAAPAAGETPESLYNEGRSLYETADYTGAIRLWTKAYAKLEWSPANAEIKAGLLYNLAGAHEEAYGINNDAAHLNKAVVLLERFEENIPKIYGEGADANAERDRVRQRMRRIQDKIDKAKAEGATTSPVDEAIDEAEDQARDEPAQQSGDDAATPARDDAKREKKPGKVLMIIGGVVTGIGVATGGAAIATGIISGQSNDFSGIPEDDFDERTAQIDYGYRMNTVAVANAIASGVLVAGGIALLLVGAKKKKQANEEKGSSARLAPTFGPQGAGLVIRGRF